MFPEADLTMKNAAPLKNRKVMLSRLRPECIEEYKTYHRDVWPELLRAYCRAGIYEVSCFLHGSDLLVYMDYDEARYASCCKELEQDPVQQKWHSLMAPLADPFFQPVEFEEVFHMQGLSETSDERTK